MIVEDQIVNNPTYMLIGEAPGSEEERLGQPFVGRSGRQLTKLLLTAGIFREGCYITNVVNERPPKNDFGIYYQDAAQRTPTDNLLQAWRTLAEKIESVKPKVVIGFGGEALRALTGLKGIEAHRGSIYYRKNIPIVCTFHPAAILRGGGTSYWYAPAAIHDMQRAKMVVTQGLKPLSPKLRLVTNPAELDNYLGTVSQTTTLCAFDIETEYKGGEWIKCIGFSDSPQEGVVVPFANDVLQNQLELLQVIKKWMTLDQIEWIGQNAYNFDIPTIKRVWGFDVKGFAYDTMVMHHVLYPEFPHDLATISSFYSLIPYWKDTSEENLYQYNCNDAVSTFIDMQGMWEEMKKRGFDKLYTEYYQPLLLPLQLMTIRGMRIDRDYQKTLREELKSEIKTLQRDLDASIVRYRGLGTTIAYDRRLQRCNALIAGGRKTVRLCGKRKRLTSYCKQLLAKIAKEKTLNVRSTKDLAHFLYTVLALPVKTKKGKVTTDETALNQLYIKTQHPFLKTMLQLRNRRNMLSRWGNLKTDSNGLIGTTYSFAETGRLRSGRFEAK